jgi:hypothetical protein
LDFEIVFKNESIQHCFIEFMGKQNVQNLISFYLNADMYRQFALKELDTKKDSVGLLEVKAALKYFASGLINSYLLNASNFVATNQDDNDEPINVTNRIFYKAVLVKTVERLELVEFLDESLLDELQDKIYFLMKQKYYPEFKNYSEFHKILIKNDFIFKLTAKKNKNTKNFIQSNDSTNQKFELCDEDFNINQNSIFNNEFPLDEGIYFN